MESIRTKNGIEIRCLTNDHDKAYVIISENRCYIVDTGGKVFKQKMVMAVGKMKSEGFNFEAIILTHSHSDHASNAHALKSMYRIPVFAHVLESVYIEKGQSAPIKGTSLLTKGVSKLMQWIPFAVSYTPCNVDFKLEGQVKIGRGIVVFETPGHTTGSLTVCVDHEIALVGDAIFGTHKTSILPAFIQDEREVYKSWQFLSALNCRLYVPSHGKSVTKSDIDLELKKVGI